MVTQEVLISFREWLHSYNPDGCSTIREQFRSSHLFQRVASFLPSEEMKIWAPGSYQCSHLFQRVASFLLNDDRSRSNVFVRRVLISFREWLHSYNNFLIENPTNFFFMVLISFREWLHSYSSIIERPQVIPIECSHLFQRVASFLQTYPWCF